MTQVATDKPKLSDDLKGSRLKRNSQKSALTIFDYLCPSDALAIDSQALVKAMIDENIVK